MEGSLAERHAAVLQLIQDLKSSLDDVEPPGDLSRAQADYDAAEERHSREQNPEKKRALCRELVQYGDRLEEVQEQHKAAEAKLKEQLDIFDLRLFKEGYQKLANRASVDTGTDTNPELENDQTAYQTPDRPGNPVQTPGLDGNQLSGLSNHRSTHETIGSPGNLLHATIIQSTIERRSTRSRTHSATPSRSFSTDVDQPLGIEPTGQTAWSNKRPDNTAVSRPTKRQRQILSSDTVRGMTFDALYQGGKALWKRRMVKIGGYYYVFECEKHNKYFCKENPLQAAMSHLRGKGHSIRSSNAAQALKLLGTQVLDCSDQDFKLNNRAVDRYLAEREEKNKRRKASTMNLAQAPQTGEIYMAWFGDDDKGYWLHAFLVIPFFQRPGDSTDVQSVTGSNLNEDIPACYRLDGTTGGYNWTEDYKENGKYANNRVYPIMCLVGQIPYKVDWLPICHFRKLNLDDEDLEDKDVIKAFIRKITTDTEHGNEVEDDSEELYGDSLAGDDDAPTSSGHRRSLISSASENVNTDQNIHTGATADSQGSMPLGPNLATQEIKDEPATIGRGDGATGATDQPAWARQMSVRRRWPSARKGPPEMETVSDSE